MFYLLSILAVFGALGAVLRKNPIIGAMHLALAMTALAGLYFSLGARFVAAVQLAVYAGAVMVLFVMVIMLFSEEALFKEEKTASAAKAVLCMILFGLLSGVMSSSVGFLNKAASPEVISTQSLAFTLFSKYVFLFEWLGFLLLIIAVGVVVLSKGRGQD